MVADDLTLQDGQGIVLLTASCDERIGSFSSVGAGVNPETWRDETEGLGGAGVHVAWCPQSPEIRTFSVPSGDHYFQRVAAGIGKLVDLEEIPEDAAMSFTVTPGAITYIGDIRLDIVLMKTSPKFSFQTGFRVLDLEAQALPEAKRIYPMLFEKYDYVKKLARME